MLHKKVRSSVNKGVARVPVVMQLEALECGAAALAMIMAYYDKWIPLEQVRLDCGVSRDGSNAKNIYIAAQRYGFDVEAYKMDPVSLKEEGRFPCIIHWNMNHFVVLDGFSGKYVYINDPARGAVRISWEEFDESFTGVVLNMTPSADFRPEGRKKSVVQYAQKRLKGAGIAVAFVMLATAIAYLFGIVNSVTSRIFISKLLEGQNRNWLYPFIAVLVLFAFVQLTVAWILAIYSLKISGKMDVTGSTSYMWKVLRLPMEFFSQRLAGDIQSRLNLNSGIAVTMAGTLAPLLIDSIMMVFYLVLMVKQSVLLAAVGLVTVALNLVVSRIISNRRINVIRVQMRDAGMLDSATVSGIDMIETIKSSGAKNGFFTKWAGYQASYNRSAVGAERIDQIIGAIPEFLATLANYAVLIVGVILTIRGNFSIGGVMMFQGFLTAFMQPAQTLVEAGQSIMEMRTSMERIEDVMEYHDDPGIVESSGTDVKLEKLSGNIEMRNVTFGYSSLAKPLITDFSLTVKPRQSIAIVGPTGSGKSTIGKLLSGLYQPWSGTILFDGKTRNEYPRDIITGSLAVVDQDIILFEDTIANNIKMWDNSIQDFEMILAARDAQIHDDITALPGGYSHRLVSGGRNMSGGQCQRLEIARVLAQDPTILILDEATSALDAATEYEVVKAIRDRGITCIIIAHRLSTIRDCDEIIVLDNGIISERGTHDELIKNGGLYSDLIDGE